MSDFKVGDKVTLRPDSEFFDPEGLDEFNPFGKVGIITANDWVDKNLTLVVDWQCMSTGLWAQQCTNSYNPRDLDLAE